ncbi:uncharacterized protein LOC118193106 [Stegodyphus dumicola]|uniref:uncharacterized protein LOC118193106 n=1 Tax=Stegodyphus dumicola TaxID=202533 RepID=UPI0015B1F9AB|nr:uncharacterized protein LOC118193106 [Stegodyphus dumicola]
MGEILLISYYWVNRLPVDYWISDLEISSRTAADWNSFCREVCVEFCENDMGMLGGMNVIVEIDESKFGKRKYQRGRRVEGKWVFGGIERGSNKCFFKVVRDRSKDCLLSFIKEYILPGTIIISDCWKSYECLEDEGFKHLAVNHKYYFKDPETGAHTNTIEGTWSAIKSAIPRHCDKENFGWFTVTGDNTIPEGGFPDTTNLPPSKRQLVHTENVLIN